MADKKEKPEERSERMARAREELAAYDQERMDEAAKQAAKAVSPAKELCESSEFKIVMQRAKDVRVSLVGFDQLTSLMNSLTMLGEALPGAVDRARQQALQQIHTETLS